MGGIHPRVKKIVGIRLAKAAWALVYGSTNTVWTGPVLTGCTLDKDRGITLSFDQEKLKQDTIMVLDQTSAALPFADESNRPWDQGMLALLSKFGPESPVEIQLNGGNLANMTDGIWLPVHVQSKCQPSGVDSVHPGTGPFCNWNVTTSSKLPGWDQVVVPLNLGALASNVTGVRYAWGTNPCCPSVNRRVIPCPPNSCPIQSFNSTMPAVPFWATIKNGKCDWISTQQGHAKLVDEQVVI
jgi:hypothetical protein